MEICEAASGILQFRTAKGNHTDMDLEQNIGMALRALRTELCSALAASDDWRWQDKVRRSGVDRLIMADDDGRLANLDALHWFCAAVHS